jgi:RNA polymerase sigma-70 factor (ECF subfamily)
MGLPMADNSSDVHEWVRRIAAGDQQALAEALTRYRSRLRRMVLLRLDRRLQGRVNASNILREAYMDAANPTLPLFLWLRLLAGRRLLTVHRQHLQLKMRGVGQEVSLNRGALPQASSVSLAAQLLGLLTPPSLVAMRAEMRLRLQEALNDMDPLDREVLTLRHFEELTNGETARVLGIQKSAASNRYIRAL